MTNRFFAAAIATAAMATALALATVPAAAQVPQPPSACPDDDPAVFHPCAMTKAKTFNPARTPDDKPDFGGLWRRRIAAHEDVEAHPKTLDDAGGPSVVVEPPDGKVPMQPWADAWRKGHPEKYIHHNAACFLSGAPATMYITGLYQFLQTRDYFVVLTEEAHAYRSIPLDGRPHIGKDIALWQGDARGRWDGNTLVIETTNQNAIPWLDQRARFYTEEARVTERLTLVDANTMHYEATIDDPIVYTRPWKIAIPFRRNTQEDIELWEEDCYEGDEPIMKHFRNIGLVINRGLTAREARELKAAWEARERR